MGKYQKQQQDKNALKFNFLFVCDFCRTSFCFCFIFFWFYLNHSIHYQFRWLNISFTTVKIIINLSFFFYILFLLRMRQSDIKSIHKNEILLDFSFFSCLCFNAKPTASVYGSIIELYAQANNPNRLVKSFKYCSWHFI